MGRTRGAAPPRSISMLPRISTQRSKEMSGESLRVMIFRVESMVTVVWNGGSSSKLCQPSSNAVRATDS